MFFERHVPESCRDAYRRDAWAALLTGVYSAFVMQFVGFVAVKEFGCNGLMMGLISASPFVGGFLTLFYVNFMRGRRAMPFMVWPHAIGRAAFLFSLILHTPISFAIIASISQVLMAVAGPAYTVVIRDIYPEDKRGTVMAYTNIGIVLTMVVFTKIGGELLNSVGYKYTFLFGTAFGVAAAFVFGSIKTRPIDVQGLAEKKQSAWAFLRGTLGILKHNRENRWYAITSTVAGFGNLIVLPLIPIFQVNELHMSAGQLAWLMIAVNLALVIANPFWGRYVDLHSPIRAWAITFILYAVLFVNYFLATQWWHMIPGMLISGMATGGFNLGAMNAVFRLAEPGEESRYQALHSFVQGLRGMVGPFIGVKLLSIMGARGISSRYLFLVGTTLVVMGCGAQWMRCRKKGY